MFHRVVEDSSVAGIVKLCLIKVTPIFSAVTRAAGSVW